MKAHQMRGLRNAEMPANFSLAQKKSTEAGQGAHDGDRRDPLHGVRCGNEAWPGFVLKVPSPEVAHIEEGIGLLTDRCRIRHSDPIRGDVRDRTLSVWMSVR